MLLHGKTTVESLAHIQGLIAVPKLFDEPDEGYTSWIQGQVSKPNPISPGTIPARIIEAEGEGRYWGWLLPRIISGQYENELLADCDDEAVIQDICQTESIPELQVIGNVTTMPIKLRRAARAKLYRRQFEVGYPLYIGMWKSLLRYKNVVPVLVYLGERKYQVGSRQNGNQFTANDHAQAIDLARVWYNAEHEKEIAAAKAAARKLGVPRMLMDLLGAVLDRDGEIYDELSTRVAWKNGGVHSRFGVVAPEWCYIMKCSPATAGLMLAVAQMEAKKLKVAAPLRTTLTGRVPAYLGLQQNGNEGIGFDGGRVIKHPSKAHTYGVIVGDNGRPSFQVVYTPPPNDRAPALVKVLETPAEAKRKPKEIGSSATVVSWGLTELDCVAWGVWSGGNYLRQKNRKK